MPKVFRERPDLENSNFRGQNLAKADFRNAGLSGADFSRANLRQADFSGADLQGTKFRNADLRGATFIKASGEAQPGAGSTDFSEAKIQGANFTEATLTQANFSGVQAGLSQGWAFVVIFCAGLFSLLSAFPAVLTGVFTTHFFLDSRRQPSGLTLTATGLGAILLTVALRTVLNYFWGPAAIAAHVFIGIGLILIIAVVIAPTVTIDDSKAGIGSIVLLVIAALAPLALFLFTSTFRDAEDWLAQRFPLLAEYITHIPGAAPTNGRWLSGWFGALIGAGFGGYFAHLAIAGDKRFDWLWKIYLRVAVSGGTRFNGADLTDADFTAAALKGADFKEAKVIRTSWRKAEGLEYARIGSSYLKYPHIRLLLTGLRLKKKEFEGLALAGINLEGADLAHANFVGADLQQANLKNTNLEQANLAGAKLQQANLQQANLQKANIKQATLNGTNLGESRLTAVHMDEQIGDEATNIRGVKCDFVFFRAVPDEHGNMGRFPAFPVNLKPGDFEKIFRKASATISLLIRNDDNREALQRAFVRLQEETHYIIQGFEMIGDDALVKIQVPQRVEAGGVDTEFRKVYQDELEQVQDTSTPGVEQERQGSLRTLVSGLFELVRPIKERRLQELEKQAAIYGLDCPPHIRLEIEDLRKELGLPPNLSQTLVLD